MKMKQSSRKARKTMPLEKEAPFFQCGPSQPRAAAVKGEKLMDDVNRNHRRESGKDDMSESADKMENASRSHSDLSLGEPPALVFWGGIQSFTQGLLVLRLFWADGQFTSWKYPASWHPLYKDRLSSDAFISRTNTPFTFHSPLQRRDSPHTLEVPHPSQTALRLAIPSVVQWCPSSTYQSCMQPP